jgi:hypothetical protein
MRLIRHPLLSSLILVASLFVTSSDAKAEKPLAVATFKIDATPPLGSPLCDGLVVPAKEIVDPLTARGVVLLTNESPIVLVAVDWVGIGNSGYDLWRKALAEAAHTTPERVAVHCLHQHDAPGCDFEAETLLAEHGLSGTMFDPAFARQTIKRAAAAVREAIVKPQAVTHLGLGKAKVDRVASNRRVLGENGKVKYVRTSATANPDARAEPEGTVDPDVRVVSFWSGDRPLVSMTYYATHPQSYYGQGGVSWDFPGIARELRAAALPDVFHVHFNGASGNVTAGKYNDGAKENRKTLAERLAAGMKAAWEATEKKPLAAADVRWHVKGVVLPVSPRLEDEKALLADIDNSKLDMRLRIRSARDVTWARRVKSGHEIPLTCLQLGSASVLHMPGELFIEYQLAAQQMRPNDFVAMAAYGDYGPGYIGTTISYTQGGYETGPVSRVAPAVETVLVQALHDFLQP